MFGTTLFVADYCFCVRSDLSYREGRMSPLSSSKMIFDFLEGERAMQGKGAERRKN